MRIIAGSAGGRTLVTPPGTDTRPTSEQIRGAVFNMLVSFVPGTRVLDLFGGTGAMALEAMSRGAARCVINDPAPAAIKAIRRNADAVLGERAREICDIISRDYRSCLKTLSGQIFDLVILDPPYAMEDAYGYCLNALSRGMLSPGAIVVSERSTPASVEYPVCYESVKSRRYGGTVIDILRLTEGKME